MPTEAGLDGYQSCFCLDTRVMAMSTATTGVCDDVCQGEQLGSVVNWFRSMCHVDEKTSSSSSSTATDSESTGGSSSNVNNGNGGSWLSHHWQWVVMLVVLVVGIAAIWVGACIFRRRYLRKKEQQKFNLKNQQNPEGGVVAGNVNPAQGNAGQAAPGQSSGLLSPSEKTRRWTGRS